MLEFIDKHLLTLIIFAPLAGCILVIILPAGEKGIVSKIVSLFASLIALILSIKMLSCFDPNQTTMQFVERITWIKSIGIHYYLGGDGLSVPLIVLTTLLSAVSLIASWGITDRCKGYFSLFLILEMSMLGVFCALDFFLFYVFWEIMLVPMYFLIGIWGGPRKEYAAIKFFLYTLIGSLCMLLAILAMYFTVGENTFDMLRIAEVLSVDARAAGAFGIIVFIALFIGFAIKVPIFPFHTWLPDAHVEAPTAVSVILAGVLLKMGTYGLLRVNFPILPDAAHTLAPWIAILGVINILYGSLVAMAQQDLKKLIAYSSIGHMGFCVLGIATFQTQAVNGAIMQMLNHGMVTAGLFLIAGVIYDRAHTRGVNEFGGLATRFPIYSGFVSLVFFASLGLPGLNSFWGEFLVLVGSFNSPAPINWAANFFPLMVYIAVLGIVITAAYHLWTIQRMFLGPFNEKWSHLKDMDYREIITLTPTAIFAVTIGVYPRLILDLFTPYTDALLKWMGG
ncbi:MAG: NADH-quinone oxidoreductase subunit M [bacterium]